MVNDAEERREKAEKLLAESRMKVSIKFFMLYFTYLINFYFQALFE